MNINKVRFAGNIGSIKSSAMPDGTAVANLRVAATKRFKGRDGSQQEKTTWMTVTAFGRRAEVISQYFQKGDPIYVEGELDINVWEDEAKQKRQSVQINIREFHFVGNRQSAASQPAAQPQGAPAPAGNGFDDFDDDIPF